MKKVILILIASIGINFYLSAQSAGDYRSVGNGNWNYASKCESFNGNSWTGQLVKLYPVKLTKGNNQVRIPVNDIRPGMYFLRINKDALNLIRKFVIAR